MIYQDEIIDTHMHLWDLANHYPWLSEALPDMETLIGDYGAIRKNFLIQDYLALAQPCNITKSVHVQAVGFVDDPVGETRWLQRIADEFIQPNAIVGYAKLDDDHIEATLQGHKQYKNTRGIRMILNWHDTPGLRMTDRPDFMEDEKWLHGFSLLQKYDLSFDLQIFPHQAAQAAILAKQFPDTSIILEHLCWPLDFSKSGQKEWEHSIQTLAQCDNITFKLSCMGCAFRNSVSDNLIQTYLQKAITHFGTKRCMFGSNFPPDSLFYSLEALVKLTKEALTHLKTEEQRDIFYNNAKKIYKIS